LFLQIFNASEELAKASQYKDIRLMTVAMKTSTKPLPDLLEITEPWTLPNASELNHLMDGTLHVLINSARKENPSY
jgi:hypothetical protein